MTRMMHAIERLPSLVAPAGGALRAVSAGRGRARDGSLRGNCKQSKGDSKNERANAKVATETARVNLLRQRNFKCASVP
eukprot:6297573-Pyramimonas_sp.AAC.1